MSEKGGTPDYFGGAELLELFKKASAILAESTEKLEKLAEDPQNGDAKVLGLILTQQKQLALLVDLLVAFVKRASEYINMLVKGYMILSYAFEAINNRLPDELRVAKLLEEISKGEGASEDAKRLLEALRKLVEQNERRLEEDIKEGRIA